MGHSEYAVEQLADFSRQLKALSEPNRLLLLQQILEGVQCNCELGASLQMAPNLISHHLGVLREAGLVEVDRNPDDARWVYYSVNLKAIDELKAFLGGFFDPNRIQPRKTTCGPQAADRLSLGSHKPVE